MTDVLLLGGLVIACFVAYNIGGATTGPAFGPAVGAGVIGKASAAALMSVFFFAGAWTIACRTIETLGSDITDLPLTAAIVVAVVASLIVILLSAIGIPASFVIIATMCIVGLFGGIVAWITGFPATLVAAGKRIDALAPVVAYLSAAVLLGFGVFFLVDAAGTLSSAAPV